MTEKLSVVIPLYNKEDTIARTIDSVLTQSMGEFTLYIIDDGSTDTSCVIVDDYVDDRLVLIRQKNQGVSAARNRGIELAESGLIAFLDADDFWDEGMLVEMLRLRGKYASAGLYAVGYRQIRPDGKYSTLSVDPGRGADDVLMDDYLSRSRFGNFVHSSSVMIPFEVLNGFGGFPVGEKFGEDLLVWAMVSSQFPIAASRKILGNFTLDPTISAPRHTGGFVRHPLLEYLVSITEGSECCAKSVQYAGLAIRSKLIQILDYQARVGANEAMQQLVADKRFGARMTYWRVLVMLPGRIFSIRLSCRVWRCWRNLRHWIAVKGILPCGVIQTKVSNSLDQSL